MIHPVILLAFKGSTLGATLCFGVGIVALLILLRHHRGLRGQRRRALDDDRAFATQRRKMRKQIDQIEVAELRSKWKRAIKLRRDGNPPSKEQLGQLAMVSRFQQRRGGG